MTTLTLRLTEAVLAQKISPLLMMGDQAFLMEIFVSVAKEMGTVWM